MYPLNTRVRLVADLDAFNLGAFPKGAAGTVIDTSEYGGMVGMVRMDDHFPALDEWDNGLMVWADTDCIGEITWAAFEIEGEG